MNKSCARDLAAPVVVAVVMAMVMAIVESCNPPLDLCNGQQDENSPMLFCQLKRDGSFSRMDFKGCENVKNLVISATHELERVKFIINENAFTEMKRLEEITMYIAVTLSAIRPHLHHFHLHLHQLHLTLKSDRTLHLYYPCHHHHHRHRSNIVIIAISSSTSTSTIPTPAFATHQSKFPDTFQASFH